MADLIDKIRKKLNLFDEVLQDNCPAIDWAHYSVKIDEIKENVTQLEQEIRNKAIDEFAHQLKETLNQEFPSNYESTRPYFTLENARILVDEIAKQMKGV